MEPGGTLLLLALCLGCAPGAGGCPRDCTCYEPLTVSCQHQGFSSVPERIPAHSQRIFLQNNRIPVVRTSSFSARHNLTVLWLHSNNISLIQGGAFRGLGRLEELDIGDNVHLQSLAPSAFQGLVRLHTLQLHHCGLSALPGDLFRGLVSLQYLYLQDNQLQRLPDDLFADLANLTYLFLHGNRIQSLSANAFRGLVNLDRLLLHQNRVSWVHSRAFHDLGKLVMLYLFNNNLTVLSGDTMAPLTSLQYLRLNGNQWICDCRAKSLWEWFQRFRGSSSQLECHAPPHLAQKDLKGLNSSDIEGCMDSSNHIHTSIFSTKTQASQLSTNPTPLCCPQHQEQSATIYNKNKPGPSSYNSRGSSNTPLKDKENISNNKQHTDSGSLSKNGTYRHGLSDAPMGTFSANIDHPLVNLSPELLDNLESATLPTTKKKRKCYKKLRADSPQCRLNSGQDSPWNCPVLLASCLLLSLS